MGNIISLGRAFAAISIFSLFAFVSIHSAFAQEEVESVKQRLDRLEKQNDDLRKLLEQRNGLPKGDPSEKELTKTTSLTNTPADILVLPTLGAEAATGADAKPADSKLSNLFKWT
ncbi:MAG: hypothetical protein RL595_1521, partial [Planctomycetota bacterium]